MKRILITTAFVLCFVSLCCSETIATALSSISPPDSVMIFADEMPEFPGGLSKLMEFVNANLRYPEEAIEAHITGKVFASFVVGSDGYVRDVVIAKGIGYGCDEEVKRVIEAMPKWKPGIYNQKKVPVRYSIPVSFSLDDGKLEE